MTKKLTVEELLEKAKRPAKLAMAYHPFYEGKVQVMPKCAIRGSYDFAIWRARAMHAYDVSTVYKAITAFEVEV